MVYFIYGHSKNGKEYCERCNGAREFFFSWTSILKNENYLKPERITSHDGLLVDLINDFSTPIAPDWLKRYFKEQPW